jgi:hypothetical protein
MTVRRVDVSLVLPGTATPDICGVQFDLVNVGAISGGTSLTIYPLNYSEPIAVTSTALSGPSGSLNKVYNTLVLSNADCHGSFHCEGDMGIVAQPGAPVGVNVIPQFTGSFEAFATFFFDE